MKTVLWTSRKTLTKNFRLTDEVVGVIIQIDSREKARAIKDIVAEFDRQGITHPVSKLMVGDYMNYDNPRLIIDRKQNLSELCNNVCNDHERFRRELVLAQ